MPAIDCHGYTDEMLPILIGELVEVREGVNREDHGFIGAIKASTQERFNQITCAYPPPDREKVAKKNKESMKTIMHAALKLESEIAKIIQKVTEGTKKTGFVAWQVWDGKNLENPLFQRLLLLYELRYGHNEALKVGHLFADAANNGKYILFIEYGEYYTGAGLYIRKVWLREIQNASKEEMVEGEKEKGKESRYFEPVS